MSKLMQSIFLVMFLFACNGESGKQIIRIKVIDNQNKAVAGASVKLDGKEEGRSDENGELKIATGFFFVKSRQLSVEKESEDFYYSPFFKRLDLPFPDTQEAQIEAVLYTVEKKTSKDSEKSGENAALVEKQAEEVLSEKPEEVQTQEIPVPKENDDVTKIADEKTPDDVLLNQSEEDAQESVLQEDSFNLPFYGINDKLEENSKNVLPANSEKKRYGVFTLLIKDSKRKALSDAEVFLGNPKVQALFPACTSNRQGRCVITRDHEFSNIFVLVRKKGYFTYGANVDLMNEKRRIIYLEKGMQLDVLALTQNYGSSKAIKDVEVRIDEQLVGKTNEYGYLGYRYSGRKDDLTVVKLLAPNHEPEFFETNYVVQDQMQLIKYFQKREPAKPKFVFFPLDVIQAMDGARLQVMAQYKEVLDTLNSDLHRAFSNGGAWFDEFPFASAAQKMKDRGESPRDLLQGWEGGLWSQYFQFVVLPTIVRQQDSWGLEIRLVDQRGAIASASFANLGKVLNRDAIKAVLPELSNKIAATFPFEGWIAAKTGNDLKLAFSPKAKLEAGRMLRIFGMQIHADGRGKSYAQVGSAQIGPTLEGKITDTVARSVIEKGDKLQLQITGLLSEQELHVISKEGASLKNARAYQGGYFAGFSDARGNLALRKTESESEELLILKEGFAPLSERKNATSLHLEPGSRTLWLGSEPAGAKVYVNKQLLGATPFVTFLANDGTDIDIGILAPPGFRSENYSIRSAGALIDYQWQQEIVLDLDLLAAARNFISAKRYLQAKDILSKIKKDSPDYFLARHLLAQCAWEGEENASAALAYYEEIPFKDLIAQGEKRFFGPLFNYLVLSLQHKVDPKANELARIYQDLQDVAKNKSYLRESDATAAAVDIPYYSFEAAKALYLGRKTADWLLKLQNHLREFESNLESSSQDKEKYISLKNKMKGFVGDQRAG